MATLKKKLLDKTLGVYIYFSLAVLLISAPMFYFISKQLFIQDTKKVLLLYKREFEKYCVPVMMETDIELYNKMNRNRIIGPRQSIPMKDSIFTAFYYDSLVPKSHNYLVLKGSVMIEKKTYAYLGRRALIESQDLIKNIALLFCMMIGLLLLGFYIITKKLSNKLWKPFYETLLQIEQFEIDKVSSPKLTDNDIDEFTRLNDSINNLIRKNIAIYKSQSEFIENAAHELQTPLAIFQSKFDTLIQRSDITKGQSEILEKLHNGILRLNKLNKNLSLLSKIDNQQYTIENLSLKEIITKQLSFFTEQAEEKNTHIIFETNEDIKVKANETLTEILISNLILNAVTHNIHKGKINILLNKNSLIISNTGINQTLSNEKLFQRFAKANPTTKGSGLGLYIIKKISELYNWQVSYSFSENVHIFIVKFS